MSTDKPKFDLDPELFVDHAKLGFNSASKAMHYIRDNRLWHGFWNYGWVSKILMMAGLLVGLEYLDIYGKWANNTQSANMMQSVVNTGALIKDFAVGSFDMFYNGTLKYVILILMEVFIFHVVRRCFEMLSGKEMDDSFKAFMQAQIRMIKVIFKCWLIEIILTFIISTLLSVFGLEMLKYPLLLVVQCYFLGFAVIDNYHEMFEMSIRESDYATREMPGLALSIGLIVYILMLIPLAGAVIGPLIGAVAATLALYKLDPDLITYRSNEPLMSA